MKSRPLFLMCQRSQGAFERWENVQGPGQDAAHPKLEVLKTRCVHRSVDEIDEIVCELCGAVSKTVAVFACTEFAECTLLPTGGRSERAKTMPSCLRCDSYSPVTCDA
jgi:hypothetical protein